MTGDRFVCGVQGGSDFCLPSDSADWRGGAPDGVGEAGPSASVGMTQVWGRWGLNFIDECGVEAVHFRLARR